jgi:4-aminobutyrate aminotransferase/(S)-3-amino-2-methylpropionate transaminase
VAIEIVDPASGAPDAATTGRVAAACHADGLLVLTAGTFGNVLRFLPPLVIGDDLVQDGLDVLAKALNASAR